MIILSLNKLFFRRHNWKIIAKNDFKTVAIATWSESWKGILVWFKKALSWEQNIRQSKILRNDYFLTEVWLPERRNKAHFHVVCLNLYSAPIVFLCLLAYSFNAQPSSAWLDILLLIICDVLAYHRQRKGCRHLCWHCCRLFSWVPLVSVKVWS